MVEMVAEQLQCKGTGLGAGHNVLCDDAVAGQALVGAPCAQHPGR
jgi:hypothetical protein